MLNNITDNPYFPYFIIFALVVIGVLVKLTFNNGDDDHYVHRPED
jgi:hypothetical protein